MSFSITKFIKGLRVYTEGTTNPAGLEILPGGTAGTTTTIQGNQTSNITITLPNTSSNLVSENGTQTLTNKTIDADLNTITNIENADIKAGAAIDASKIADGSVSSAEFQFINSVTSNVQTQIDNKQPLDATLTALAGLDATAGLVVETAADTFTKRTLTAGSSKITIGNGSGAAGNPSVDVAEANLTISNMGGTLAINQGGTGQVTAVAAFNALAPTTTKADLITRDASNNIRLPVGSDGQVLVADSAQTSGLKWSQISGIKNYILNSDAEATANGWVAYADAAGAAPVDGTGGSPTVTITRSTSSPLRGVGSFLITKDAANRQGQGVSYDFSIDSADQAKPLAITMDFTIASGTYSGGTSTTDSDVTCYIYDVTNALVIQPAGFKLDGGVVGVNHQLKAEFQSASNSTSYRLIFHVSTTSASAYTIKYDNVVVGPLVTSAGSAQSDPVAFTPTLTTSGGGAITLNATAQVAINGFSYRDGSDLVGSVSFKNGSGGAATGTAGTVLIGLPTGLVADTAKIAAAIGGGRKAGEAQFFGGTNFSAEQTVTVASGDIALQVLKGASSVAYAVADLVASSGMQVNFRIPIVGWSSNTVVSSDTDTRVVAAKLNGTTAASYTSGNTTKVPYNNSVYDSHGALSTASNNFTAPVPGYYNVIGSISIAGGTFVAGSVHSLAVFVDAVQVENLGVFIPDAGVANTVVVKGASDFYLNAGQIVDLRFTGTFSAGALTFSNNTGNCFFAVSRKTGPSQIAASESVNCRISTSTSSTTSGAGVADVIFTSKSYDSHSAYNTSTGVFTVPVSGKYSIKARLGTSAASAADINRVMQVYLVRNGTGVSFSEIYANSTASREAYGIHSDSFRFFAGDTLKIQWTHNWGVTLTCDGTSSRNFLSIERIGN